MRVKRVSDSFKKGFYVKRGADWEATRLGVNERVPDVSLSRVVGFLEVLHDNNDNADLVKLATDLDLEVDALVPVLNAAQLLDFVKLKGGRAYLTSVGRELVEQDLLKRRELVKQKLLSINLFKNVVTQIEKSKAGRIKRRALVKSFRGKLPREDAERMVQRIIGWGRHAALIGFDADSGEVYLIK